MGGYPVRIVKIIIIVKGRQNARLEQILTLYSTFWKTGSELWEKWHHTYLQLRNNQLVLFRLEQGNTTKKTTSWGIATTPDNGRGEFAWRFDPFFLSKMSYLDSYALVTIMMYVYSYVHSYDSTHTFRKPLTTGGGAHTLSELHKRTLKFFPNSDTLSQWAIFHRIASSVEESSYREKREKGERESVCVCAYTTFTTQAFFISQKSLLHPPTRNRAER